MWNVDYGLWTIEYAICNMEYGMCMEYVIWEYGI